MIFIMRVKNICTSTTRIFFHLSSYHWIESGWIHPFVQPLGIFILEKQNQKCTRVEPLTLILLKRITISVHDAGMYWYIEINGAFLSFLYSPVKKVCVPKASKRKPLWPMEQRLENSLSSYLLHKKLIKTSVLKWYFSCGLVNKNWKILSCDVLSLDEPNF